MDFDMDIYQNNVIDDLVNVIADSDIIRLDNEHLSNDDKIKDFMPKDLNESFIESTIADSNYVSEASVTLTEGSVEKDEDSLEYQIDDANIISFDNNTSNDSEEIESDFKHLCDNNIHVENNEDFVNDIQNVMINKIELEVKYNLNNDIDNNLNNINLIEETKAHSIMQSDNINANDLSDKDEKLEQMIDETLNDDLDDGKFFDCEDSGFNDSDTKSDENKCKNLDSNLSETNIKNLNKSTENLSDTIVQDSHQNQIYKSCAKENTDIVSTEKMDSDLHQLTCETVCEDRQMDGMTNSSDNNLANDIFTAKPGEIDDQSSYFGFMDLNQHDFDSSDWLYSVNTNSDNEKFDVDSAFSFNQINFSNSIINNSRALAYELSRPLDHDSDVCQYIYPNTTIDTSPVRFSKSKFVSSTPSSNKTRKQAESIFTNDTFTKLQSSDEEPLEIIEKTFEVSKDDPRHYNTLVHQKVSPEPVNADNLNGTIILTQRPSEESYSPENQNQSELVKTTIISSKHSIPLMRSRESPKRMENALEIEEINKTLVNHRRPSIPLMNNKLNSKPLKISPQTEDINKKQQITNIQKITPLTVDHEEPPKLNKISTSVPAISHLKKPTQAPSTSSNLEKVDKLKRPTGLIPPSTSRVNLYKDSNRPSTPKSGDESLSKLPTERSNAQINQLKSKSLIKRPADLVKPKSNLKIPNANPGAPLVKSNLNALSRETVIPAQNGVLIRSNIKLDSNRRHTVIEMSTKEPINTPAATARPLSMIKLNEFKQPLGISKMVKPLRASVATVSGLKKPDESVSKLQKSSLMNLRESGIPKTKPGLKPPNTVQVNLKKSTQSETLSKPIFSQSSSILPIQSENPPIISPINNSDTNILNRTFDRDDFQILKSFTNSNNNDGDNSSEASNETLQLSSDSENNNSQLSNRSLISQAHSKMGIYQLALKEEENLKKHVNTVLIGQTMNYRSLKLPSQPKPRGIPTFKK